MSKSPVSSSQARIAIVGCPGLSGALKLVADRHMPRVVNGFASVEYESITPNGDGDSVAETIISLQPHVVLLGYPQQTVSAWEIAAALEPYSICPIVLIKLTERVDARSLAGKPSNLDDIPQGSLDAICRAIERNVTQVTSGR